ncbi:MAG: hypothetical protein ACXWMF_08865 [Syntrophales bacterium]
MKNSIHKELLSLRSKNNADHFQFKYHILGKPAIACSHDHGRLTVIVVKDILKT